MPNVVGIPHHLDPDTLPLKKRRKKAKSPKPRRKKLLWVIEVDSGDNGTGQPVIHGPFLDYKEASYAAWELRSKNENDSSVYYWIESAKIPDIDIFLEDDIDNEPEMKFNRHVFNSETDVCMFGCGTAYNEPDASSPCENRPRPKNWLKAARARK
jgi:hypothetical protein